MAAAVEIACHQVLMKDASVWSVQSLAIPPGHIPDLSAETLFRLYLDHIRRFTLGLVQPRLAADGIHFSLAGSGISLICFAPPDKTPESICIRICGGALVQRDNCHRGELTFAVTRAMDGSSTATLSLSDFCPLLLGSAQPSLLRKWLYRFTQAAIHKVVTIRFLARVYRQLWNPRACIRVIKLPPGEGENI